MIPDRFYRFFESLIDPFEEVDQLRPPQQSLCFFWHHISQSKMVAGFLLIFGGCVALLEAALFYFIGRTVDILNEFDATLGWLGLFEAHGHELLFMLFITVIARVIVVAGVGLLENQMIYSGFVHRVRWQSHLHVSKQNLSFFQDDFAGRIATKVLQTGQATSDLMITALQVVWFISIYSITTMAMVAALDWRLAALVGLWILLFAALARYFLPRLRKNARKLAEALSAASGRLVDSYSNMQTLKLFSNHDSDDHFLREGIENFIKVQHVQLRYLTSIRISLAFLSGIMIALIGYLSIDLWLENAITIGAVAFAMSLMLRLALLLGRLMTQLNSLMRNYGTMQNGADMISKPIGLLDAPDAKELQVTKTAIAFDHVEFDYLEDKPVIKNLSLDIKPGEKIGLIGPSGAGKSTLINLLLRFYELSGGTIRIDGQDISQVTQRSLRAQIGVVTQDTALLHRSMRDNILFGNQDADNTQLSKAIERSQSSTFINDLEDYKGRKGLDAYAGERGVKLSGGQRQRIAIARVILKDAPILVLDEATSALDSEVEAVIQSHLEQLMDGKTVIAIAHRLSTIAKLDRLIVLDKGQIAEQGTHQDLLKHNGIYARLWHRQSGGFIHYDEADESDQKGRKAGLKESV